MPHVTVRPPIDSAPDLRELNEFNFARFDAKLGQRIAELKSELLKWMFLFWATTGLALGALFLRK